MRIVSPQKTNCGTKRYAYSKFFKIVMSMTTSCNLVGKRSNTRCLSGNLLQGFRSTNLLYRLRRRFSGRSRSPDCENDSGCRTSYKLVSNIQQIQAGLSAFEYYRCALSGNDKTQPKPEGSLQPSHRVCSVGVLNEVSQDIDQNH